MIQRAAYKRGKLSQDRIDKLNSVGFSWSAHSDERWNENFKEFKSRIERAQNIGRAERLRGNLDSPERALLENLASPTKKVAIIPCGSRKDWAMLNEWTRKQPKDAKEKKEQRQFELFQQFLKWREENE